MGHLSHRGDGLCLLRSELPKGFSEVGHECETLGYILEWSAILQGNLGDRRDGCVAAVGLEERQVNHDSEKMPHTQPGTWVVGFWGRDPQSWKGIQS